MTCATAPSNTLARVLPLHTQTLMTSRHTLYVGGSIQEKHVLIPVYLHYKVNIPFSPLDIFPPVTNLLLGMHRVVEIIHQADHWIIRASIYFCGGTIGFIVVVMAFFNLYHIIYLKRKSPLVVGLASQCSLTAPWIAQSANSKGLLDDTHSRCVEYLFIL